MERKYKNHLINADYELFNFRELYEEKNNKDYEGILWRNSNNLTYEKGDRVFIRYRKLPDKTNRILLYGKVLGEKDYDEFKTPGILIGDCRGIMPTDSKKFCYENLKNKYGISNFRSSIYLKEDVEGQNNLIKDLNEEIEKGNTVSLGKLKENFFNFVCSFKECKEFKANIHSTFERENGLSYSLGHHLIKQEFRKCNNEIDKLIDYEENLIMLCPLCHERIHHGCFSDRRKMIEYLYNKNKSKYDMIINKIRKFENKELKDSNIEWLFLSYLNSSEKEVYFNK